MRARAQINALLNVATEIGIAEVERIARGTPLNIDAEKEQPCQNM